MPPDGSLAVYFARKGIPCASLKADLDYLNATIEMLRAARSMVADGRQFQANKAALPSQASTTRFEIKLEKSPGIR